MSDDEIVKLYADKDEKAIAATKEKYHNYLYKISFQVFFIRNGVFSMKNVENHQPLFLK